MQTEIRTRCEACKEFEAAERCLICGCWFCFGCAAFHAEECGVKEENK